MDHSNNDGDGNGGGPKPENAWVYFNDDDCSGEDFDTWVDLLSNEQNRRGLVRISIEYFARRGGYKEVAEIGCVDHKGKTPTATSLAVLNPKAMARDAYGLATKDHRRNARTHYRMQLWHASTKRGEAEKRGDCVAVRFDSPGHGDLDFPNRSPENAIFKVARDFTQDARQHTLKVGEAYVQILQTSASASVFALQIVDEMVRKKSELADIAAAMRMQPTADDVTRRIESVMSRLEGPLQIFASAVAPKVRQWADTDPGTTTPPAQPGPSSSSSSAPPNQANAQAFFEGLTADQKDGLRDAMGSDKFGALAEVIMGSAEQWATEAQHIKPTLLPHLAALRTILTAEQLAQLMAV